MPSAPLPPARRLSLAAIAFVLLPPAPHPPPGGPHPRFEDVRQEAGIAFAHVPPLFDLQVRHVNALWANFVAPVAVGDFDRDGDDDMLFVSTRAGVPN